MDTQLPYGLKPISQKIQDTYVNITWQQLIDDINDVLPSEWLACWDYSGGGCSGIIILTDEYAYTSKSFMRVCDIDVPSIGEYQKEIYINEFNISVHDVELVANKLPYGNEFEEGKAYRLMVQGSDLSKYDWIRAEDNLIKDNQEHNLAILTGKILELLAPLNTVKFERDY